MLASQPAPLFRNHDRVGWILRVVLHRRGNADAAGVQVDAVTQVGHVLRGFVSHAAHVVVINQELHAAVSISVLGRRLWREFGNIGNGSVDDAPDGADLVPALLLELLRTLAITPDKKGDTHTERGHTGGDQRYWIKTKGVHAYPYFVTTTVVRKL